MRVNEQDDSVIVDDPSHVSKTEVITSTTKGKDESDEELEEMQNKLDKDSDQSNETSCSEQNCGNTVNGHSEAMKVVEQSDTWNAERRRDEIPDEGRVDGKKDAEHSEDRKDEGQIDDRKDAGQREDSKDEGRIDEKKYAGQSEDRKKERRTFAKKDEEQNKSKDGGQSSTMNDGAQKDATNDGGQGDAMKDKRNSNGSEDGGESAARNDEVQCGGMNDREQNDLLKDKEQRYSATFIEPADATCVSQSEENNGSAKCAQCRIRVRTRLQRFGDMTGFSLLLTHYRFTLFVTTVSFAGLCHAAVSNHFILSVVDRGITEQDASFLMSFFGVGNIFGKIITAFVLGRKLARLMSFYVISVLGWGVSIMLLRVPTSFAWFVVVALFVGIFSGANICMHPIVIRHVVGVDMIGRGFGVLMIFAGIGNIEGPIISGKIYCRIKLYSILHSLYICIFYDECLIVLRHLKKKYIYICIYR